MDEQLIRRLSRQLRILNAFLIFFMLVFLTTVAVAGYFGYKAYQEVRKAENNLTDLQNRAKSDLDVKDNLCSSGGSLGSLLKNQSDVCN